MEDSTDSIESINSIGSMRTLKEWFGEGTATHVFEAMVKTAILDPNEKLRNIATNYFANLFSGETKLNRGFMGDNHLMLDVQQGNNRAIIYVCDMPKEYLGQKSQPRSFSIKQVQGEFDFSN